MDYSCIKKSLRPFRKYDPSKPLIFDLPPPLSISVHFACKPLATQHVFTLVSYPNPSQKKYQDAYETRAVKRDKIIICFKLKDGNVFLYTITIKIFTSHKKKFKIMPTPF